MWNYNVAEAQHSFAVNSEQKQVRVRREQRDFGIFMRKLFIFDLCTRDKCKRRTEEEEGVGGGLCRDGRGRRTAMLNVANNVQKERITPQHKRKSKKCKKTRYEVDCMYATDEVDSAFVCVCKSQTKRSFLSFKKEIWSTEYLCSYLFDFYLSSPPPPFCSLSMSFFHWSFHPSFTESRLVAVSRLFFQPKEVSQNNYRV